ncbi:hypothetical protein CK214_08575 [Mesorhizobium sp. WSM3882]|nr:hypothetical protein CK214_08575 [Mesorhizobium sp. WSM3882]
MCEQRIDARFGISIIIIGITIELFAALHLEVPFGMAVIVVAPLVCTFHYYQRMYLYWVTRDSLLFAVYPVDQRTWRYHFPDVSEQEWRSALSAQERILRLRGKIS